MTSKQYSTTKATNCFQYCVNGMNERLFEFYEEHKPLYSIILNKEKTREDKIHKFLYLPNAFYLSMAIAKHTKSVFYGTPEALRIFFSPDKNEFEMDLDKTLRTNQDLFLSMLSKEELKKINSIIQG